MYEQSEASNFLLPKQLKSVRMKYSKSFSLLVGLTIASSSVVAQGLLVKGAYLKVKQNTLIKIKSGGFHNKTINNNLSNEGIIALDGLLQNLGSISGTILMNGTSNIDAYIGVLQNLEISTNGTVRAADHGSVSRLLKINSGATFDTNGKNIVLESDANQTALVHHNGGNTLGDFEVQRHISTGNGHHFISAPTNNASIQELADDFPLNLSGGSPHVYYYDETNTATTAAMRWRAPASLSHPMEAGEGFTFWFNTNGGKTIDINGPINNGTVPIPMTFTHSIPVSSNTNGPYSPEGWNFIGNPYAAPIDYNAMIAAAPSAVAHGMYRWDPNTSTYISYINGISNPANYNAIIPSMQGFWLRTSANCTLNLDNSMRVTDPDIVSSIFLKNSNTDPISRLELSGLGKKIETVLTFNQYANNSFDPQLDAYFLPSDESDEIILASKIGQHTLSINSLGDLGASNHLIPLHFKVSTAGTYSIQISEFTNFPAGTILILEDQQLSTSQILNQGLYQFVGSPNDNENRFRLNVVPDANSINSVENKEAIKVYTQLDDLVLETNTVLQENQRIQISDISGRLVLEDLLSAGQSNHRISIHKIPKNQLYLVRVEGLEYSYPIRR